MEALVASAEMMRLVAHPLRVDGPATSAILARRQVLVVPHAYPAGSTDGEPLA